ncbi:MFS transporter [Streptomyces sp. F8]|uniref:MFS transporter n=1 Tax=Streptomyces sp. F8 TaxID=1436085 RepID=UPI003FA791EE
MRLRDFRLLLAGAATGQFGAQVTLVALPLVAVLVLDAPAFQVGLLTAAETAAFLLVGLPAGALTDRMRKRPLMIRADLVRAAAMASIPAAALGGVLTMAQLYAVALVTGVATVFFDVAHQSYLPQILPREQLVAGNGALETVRSTAHVTGPGIGGGLVQLVGAQFAVIVDAVGYVLSALFLLRIDKTEEVPERAAGASLRKEIGEGVRFILGHPLLRVIALTTGLANFCTAVLMATQTVHLVRVVGLEAGGLGLVLSASAVGGLLGALAAGPIAARLGQARVILLSLLVTGPFALLWPLSGHGLAGAVLFAAGSAVVSFGAVVYNVANATLRFLMWGTLPLGALLGGALAQSYGSRTALAWCAAGILAVPLPLLLSPLRRMRDLPAPQDDDATDAAHGTPRDTAPAEDDERPAPTPAG